MESRSNQGVTTLVTDPSSSTGSEMPLTTGAGGDPKGESMDVGNNPELLKRIASIYRAQHAEMAQVQQQMEATPLSVETIINSLKVIAHPERFPKSLGEINLVVFFAYILNKYYKVVDGETGTRDLNSEDINKLFSGCWIVVKEDPDTKSGEGGGAMEYSKMPPLFKYFYVLAGRWPQDAPEKITIKGDEWDKSSHGLNKIYTPLPFDPFGFSYKDRNVQINIHEKISSCNQINKSLGKLSSPVDKEGNIALVIGYQEKIEHGGDDGGDFNSPFSYTWFQTENASSGDRVEHGLNWFEYMRTGKNIGPCDTKCDQTEAQFYRSQGGFINRDEKARAMGTAEFPPIILVPKQGISLNHHDIPQDTSDLYEYGRRPILAAVQPKPDERVGGGRTKKRRRKYKKIKHKKKKTYIKRKTYKKRKHIKRKKTYKKNL